MIYRKINTPLQYTFCSMEFFYNFTSILSSNCLNNNNWCISAPNINQDTSLAPLLCASLRFMSIHLTLLSLILFSSQRSAIIASLKPHYMPMFQSHLVWTTHWPGFIYGIWQFHFQLSLSSLLNKPCWHTSSAPSVPWQHIPPLLLLLIRCYYYIATDMVLLLHCYWYCCTFIWQVLPPWASMLTFESYYYEGISSLLILEPSRYDLQKAFQHNPWSNSLLICKMHFSTTPWSYFFSPPELFFLGFNLLQNCFSRFFWVLASFSQHQLPLLG